MKKGLIGPTLKTLKKQLNTVWLVCFPWFHCPPQKQHLILLGFLFLFFFWESWSGTSIFFASLGVHCRSSDELLVFFICWLFDWWRRRCLLHSFSVMFPIDICVATGSNLSRFYRLNLEEGTMPGERDARCESGTSGCRWSPFGPLYSLLEWALLARFKKGQRAC